jgi:cytochrome P450
VTAISWAWLVNRYTVFFIASPLSSLPYPPIDIFPIGHLDTNGGKPATTNIERMSKTPNNGILGLWMPGYTAVQIMPTTPEVIMELINTRAYDWEKPTAEKKILGGVVGQGLVTVDGQQHKDMRRVVAPSFHGRHIRALAPLFYTKALDTTSYIAEQIQKADGKAVDVLPIMSRITLDIIYAAGVGREAREAESSGESLSELYESIINADRGPSVLFLILVLTIPMSWFGYLKGTPYARLAAKQDRLRVKMRELLAEKKETMASEKGNEEKDIIATIMRSGEFSDEYLMDQLMTFIAAG